MWRDNLSRFGLIVLSTDLTIEAEALFMSCTALPALPVLEEIRARLGKPVLSSNQALIWAMLDTAWIPAQGPGRLFEVCTWS